MTELDDDTVARALLLEHDIDTDLRDAQTSILLAQLASARQGAINALRDLAEAPAFDAVNIMTLQNDVRRFKGLFAWLLNQRIRSRDAFALLPIEEQQEVLEYIQPKREINDA